MTDQTSDHDAEASSGRPAGESAHSSSSDLVASGGIKNEFGDDFRPEDFGGPKDITLRRLSTHSSWDGAFGDTRPLNDAPVPADARRPLSLVAMVAIAALVGAVSGGAATLSLTHFMKDDHATVAAATAAATAAAAERDKAIDGALAKVNAELASLKNGVESSNKASSAKLTKLGEALDKLKTPPAPETTGSITPPAAAPAAAPQINRLPTIDGWALRDVSGGGATVVGRSGVYEVYVGDPLPGVGRVDAIRRQDGRWVVVTSRGLIVAR